MKIQIASDLHIEHRPDNGLSIAKELISSGGADVLILAGDIGVLLYKNEYIDFLNKIKSYYRRILIVPGNHEFYGSSFGEGARLMEDIEDKVGSGYVNFMFGSRDRVSLAGQTFIGGTGWFSYLLPHEEHYKQFLSDYSLIKDLDEHVYLYNSFFADTLRKGLLPEDILISHHIPNSSIHEKYRMDALNCFFVHGLDSYIFDEFGPRLYIHGHTHEPMDYVRNKTRVICNPRGYPGQRNGFNPNLIIEV